MEKLTSIIEDLVSLNREDVYWDFKECPHDNKASLLHDILCLANTMHAGERYLIFGVTDPSDGCQIKGLTPGQKDRKTQAEYIDFLRYKKFAGQIRPEIELRTVRISNKEIDVLVVHNRPNKPYYLTDECRDGSKLVRANHIYTRINDTNTPIDKSADLYLIIAMWKQRFGIDLSSVERIRILMREPSEWFKDIGNNNYLYHTIFPEFSIKLGEHKEFKEVFSFFFTNERSFLGNAVFKYHSTPLFNLEYIYCDQMNIILPMPQMEHLEINGRSQWYYFYDRSNLNGDFLYFLTDGKLGVKDYRGGEGPFLIFLNEEHRREFNKYILDNLILLDNIEDPCGVQAAKRIRQENAAVGIVDPIFVGKARKMYDRWIKLLNKSEVAGT